MPALSCEASGYSFQKLPCMCKPEAGVGQNLVCLSVAELQHGAVRPCHQRWSCQGPALSCPRSGFGSENKVWELENKDKNEDVGDSFFFSRSIGSCPTVFVDASLFAAVRTVRLPWGLICSPIGRDLATGWGTRL